MLETEEPMRTRVTAEIKTLKKQGHEGDDKLVAGMRGLYLLSRVDFTVSSKKMRAESWISKTCLKVVSES